MTTGKMDKPAKCIFGFVFSLRRLIILLFLKILNQKSLLNFLTEPIANKTTSFFSRNTDEHGWRKQFPFKSEGRKALASSIVSRFSFV